MLFEIIEEKVMRFVGRCLVGAGLLLCLFVLGGVLYGML